MCHKLNNITILFCALLFCFIFNKGYLAKLLNNKLFGFMGKYSYSIYVMQWIVQEIIANGNLVASTKIYSSFRINYTIREYIFSFILNYNIWNNIILFMGQIIK